MVLLRPILLARLSARAISTPPVDTLGLAVGQRCGLGREGGRGGAVSCDNQPADLSADSTRACDRYGSEILLVRLLSSLVLQLRLGRWSMLLVWPGACFCLRSMLALSHKWIFARALSKVPVICFPFPRLPSVMIIQPVGVLTRLCPVGVLLVSRRVGVLSVCIIEE